MNQLTICTVAQRLDSWLCLASSHKLTRSHGFNPKEDPFLLTIANIYKRAYYRDKGKNTNNINSN